MARKSGTDVDANNNITSTTQYKSFKDSQYSGIF